MLSRISAHPPLQEYAVLPAELTKKYLTGLAVSDDQQTHYVTFMETNGSEPRVQAYKGSAVQWEAKAGAVLARYRNILLTTNPAGAGILALRATDGTLLAVVGQAAQDDHPALTGITGAAVGNRDGKDYLCVACQARVLIYRIVAAE